MESKPVTTTDALPRAAIIRQAVAVGMAVGAYGVSFGAISVAGGLTAAQTVALSVLAFTGASQFAFVGVVAGGGSPLTAAGTALLLGSRNTLYGLRLAGLLGLRGPRRLVGAQLVVDESTAMAVSRDTEAGARLGFFATGIAVFVFWNLATLAGALGGRALGDPETFGLDAAVGAAFLALVWPRLDTALTRGVALGAAAVAVLLVPVVPAGVPVIAAAGVALLAGLRGGRR